MKKYIAMTMALCVAVVAIAAFTMKTATEKRERVQTEETVELTVWASEDGQDILEQMVDGFIREYGEEADLQIHMGIEEEKSAWENIHANPRYAADVFFFTDDQMDNMVRDEILLAVTVNSEKVIEASGGKDATAVESAMRNGILYACAKHGTNLASESLATGIYRQV